MSTFLSGFHDNIKFDMSQEAAAWLGVLFDCTKPEIA